ncbi:MAG: NUDIX hydrolase [Anaerolineae bacterium]|nr:NUDIX hydrolase [Anaerolineae bacterium]
MGKYIANFCPVCGTKLELRARTGTVRPVCPNCDYTAYFDPKVAVVVFIKQDDRVLLVKRAIDPMKGRWAMPAGFVEAGEDPQAAARRESLEETSLIVGIDRLLDVFFTAGDGGAADIVIAYAATVTGGELKADDDAEEVAWFSRDNLPDVVFMPSQRLAARWLAGEI